MLTLLKNATLSAMIALGATAALPAGASAEGIYLGLDGDGARFGVIADDDGYGPRHRGDGWDRRGDDRWDRRDDDRWDRRDDWRNGRRCTAEGALDKAERMGLHRTYVRDIGRHTIRVGGRRHGDRVTITFARAPHCPVVRW